MDAGQGTVVLEVVPPPRLQNTTTGCDTPLSSSSSSVASSCGDVSSEPAVLCRRTRGYAGMQAKRCHAVLELVCLGGRSHTRTEVLSALQEQAQRWLTPRQLKPGMVVSDNGTNLLSAPCALFCSCSEFGGAAVLGQVPRLTGCPEAGQESLCAFPKVI